MKKQTQFEAANLRQKAEDLVKMNTDVGGSEVARKVSAEANTDKLIHELEVHQIELETQNEELIRVNEQASVATKKYIELYDFAPSGYFTLSKKGEILELNLAGAKILGKDRSLLKKRLFHLQLSEASKPVFLLFLEKVFISQTSQPCEVTLPKDGNPLIYSNYRNNFSGWRVEPYNSSRHYRTQAG